MSNKKYSIYIELNEEGSTSFLGEYKISAKLADKLKMMDWKKPKVLRGIFKTMISKLEWLKTYFVEE